MDPNESLKDLRDKIRVAQGAANGDSNDAEIEALQDVMWSFQELDEWLTKGGFLPAAWSQRRPPSQPAEAQVTAPYRRAHQFAGDECGTCTACGLPEGNWRHARWAQLAAVLQAASDLRSVLQAASDLVAMKEGDAMKGDYLALIDQLGELLQLLDIGRPRDVPLGTEGDQR